MSRSDKSNVYLIGLKKKLVDLHICYFFLPWAFTWACLQFSFDDADEDIA